MIIKEVTMRSLKDVHSVYFLDPAADIKMAIIERCCQYLTFDELTQTIDFLKTFEPYNLRKVITTLIVKGCRFECIEDEQEAKRKARDKMVLQYYRAEDVDL